MQPHRACTSKRQATGDTMGPVLQMSISMHQLLQISLRFCKGSLTACVLDVVARIGCHRVLYRQGPGKCSAMLSDVNGPSDFNPGP